MRIAVVGLGGVGGYIFASLTKGSSQCVGFARGEHLQAIQKNGITIVEDERRWSRAVDARSLDEADGYFDLVLFCVKSYDLRQAYEKLALHVDEQTVLLSLANGVNNGDILREISGSIVLDACVYILAHIQSPSVIRKEGKVFALVFGGEAEPVRGFSLVLDEVGLRYKIPDDIKTALWKKYIFISAFATLTSYYNKSIGYVSEFYMDEVKKLLQEIALVAASKGVDIESEIQKSLNIALSLPYDSSTSMHLDFQNSRQTELESLSGYILREADANGVDTPLMKRMYKKLRAGNLS